MISKIETWEGLQTVAECARDEYIEGRMHLLSFDIPHDNLLPGDFGQQRPFSRTRKHLSTTQEITKQSFQMLHQFDYIFAIAMIFAFLDAWNIGANDVSNSFATSVSSRSLTMKQAMFIGSIMEFAGAVGVGARVADTIRNKIISTKAFTLEPTVLMLGMTCALVSSSIYLTLATRIGLPVSTTHSIVGGVSIEFSVSPTLETDTYTGYWCWYCNTRSKWCRFGVEGCFSSLRCLVYCSRVGYLYYVVGYFADHD